MHEEIFYWKNPFWQNDCHFYFAIYSMYMSVCIGFPNYIQPEANMHFNTLLISIHKAVITITKTRLFKYIENFTSKNWEFSDKKIC